MSMRLFIVSIILSSFFISPTLEAGKVIELRDRLFFGTQYRVNASGEWKSIGFLATDLEASLSNGPVEQKDQFEKARPLGIITAGSLGIAAYTAVMNLLMTGNDWSLTLAALSIGIPSNIFYRYELGNIVSDYNSFSLAQSQHQGVRIAAQFSF